jgi:hypothetical protein
VDQNPFLSGRSRDSGTFRRVSIWQIELLPTVEADVVCTAFDGEHPTLMTVSAAKEKLENPKKAFHKSCARWRRSQLPLTSSQSSNDFTLARARAIAQSAAP